MVDWEVLYRHEGFIHVFFGGTEPDVICYPITVSKRGKTQPYPSACPSCIPSVALF